MVKKPTYEELEKKIQELERTKSEFKLSQQKLLESEEKYRNLIDKLDDIIWTLDLNLRTKYVSPSIEKKLGFTPEERIAQDPSEQMTPSSNAKVAELLTQELSREKGGLADPNRTIRVEVEYYHKSGSTQWFENVINGLRDENGNLIGIHGVSRDINDRKKAEEALRESEEKYKFLAENSADLIYKINIKNEQCIYASPSIEGLLGYTPEESLSIRAKDILTKESYVKQRERLINTVENGNMDPETMELEVIHKNGHLIPIEIKANIIYDDQGNPSEILGIARDITERKHAERELRESEERYKELFERSLDCIYVHDFEGNFIDANQTALELFGYTKEEITSLNFSSMLSEDELPKAFNAVRDIIKKGAQDGINEYKVKKKNGDYFFIETTGSLIYKDNTPHSIMGTARDITARKNAEKALQESEVKHKALVQNIPGMVYKSHADFSPEIISGSKEVSGYTNEELNSRKDSWLSIIHPDDKDKVLQEGSVLANKQQDTVQLYRIITKYGDIRWIEDRQISIFSTGGKFQGIEGIAFDITERMQMEMALLGSEERYRNIVEKTDDLITQVDGEGRITYVNHISEEIFGVPRDECIGMHAFDFIHTADKDRTMSWFNELIDRHEAKSTIENRMVNKTTGKIHEILWTCNFNYDRKGNLISANSTGKDLTDYKLLNARLMQIQKMEAIATLAGGIAHQFNNALSVITGNLELLEIHSSGNETIANYTEPMRDTTHRMARLTNQLLAYARGGKYLDKVISLSDFARDTLPLIKYTMPSDIDIDTNLPRDIFPIKADITQMQMVFSAVMQNASEAIEGNGRILISTKNVEVDEDYASNYDGLTQGSYVSLTVEDDGKGMDEETKNRVFEPFFTTKFQGRGLGMAATYGIVKNHTGYISVDSELGKGTAVRILLPAALDRT